MGKLGLECGTWTWSGKTDSTSIKAMFWRISMTFVEKMAALLPLHSVEVLEDSAVLALV